MEQITVPQFIEAEDKIVGPITVRQFVIMFVGAMLVFAEFKTSDLSLFILLALITSSIALTLAFVKVNGQPFHFFLLHVIQTIKRPSIRVWRKIPHPHAAITTLTVKPAEKEGIHPEHVKVGSKRLSELSLIVDTGGGYTSKEEEGTELF
ncbi:MAG: PrgI family protein [bacterium]|nr:PrgI family protein [bacterium]